jgi:putative ABC transport system permease protein
MPDWKQYVREHLPSLGLAPEREAEITEELAQQLEDCCAEAIANGATEEEACELVRGQVPEWGSLAEEICRVEQPLTGPIRRRWSAAEDPKKRWRSRIWTRLWQDLRYGVRTLAKSPGLTAVAVLTIGLGLGANAIIFTFVNAIMIQPPPYGEPDRLVVAFAKNVAKNAPRELTSLAGFQDWKNQNRVFEEMVAVRPMAWSVTGDGEAETAHGHYVTSGVFRLLGVQPIIGRRFLPEEERPGGNPAAVLFYSLWQQRYGGDPDIIGKKILLNFEPHTIVGVMPPRFRFPNRGSRLMVPSPMQADPSRTVRNVRVWARLKPGVTVEQAQAEMDVIALRLEQRHPETNKGWGVNIVTLEKFALREVRPALFLLFGAVGFVLLIACANVMSLSLARTVARQKEIAVRSALGAGFGDVLRLVLAEGFVLALFGGMVGLLLACGTLRFLIALLPAPLGKGSRIVQLDFIEIDFWVLGFTLAVSVLAALLVGLVPALLAARSNLNEALKDVGAAKAGIFRGRRIQDLLVIGETAIALVLVVGAGLMLQSWIRLQNVNPGLQPERVLTLLPMLPYQKYDRARRKAFHQDFVQRVERLPQVISAAGTSTLPMVGWYYRTEFGIEERTVVRGEEPRAIYRDVTSNYFQTLGIPLLAGRCFNRFDTPDSPRVVLIDEELARRYLPGENPVGKQITFGGSGETRFYEIVGVVGSIRDHGLEAAAEPVLYFAATQFPGGGTAFVIRTRTEPMNVLPLVRAEIRGMDPDVPLFRVSSLDRMLTGWSWRRRISTLLLSSLAGLALFLAAVGLYGLMQYTVTRQTREIGIRVALGAERKEILNLVVSRGLRLAVLGTVIGLILSRVLTRVVTSQLYEVEGTDPATYVAVCLLLIGVTILASYLPARRAAKLDPMEALRHE